MPDLPPEPQSFARWRGSLRELWCANSEKKKHMKLPKNIVKFRLAGFPLDALDQKRMRRLRRASDRTGVPIPALISEAVDQVIEARLAEAELPKKIVKFPSGRTIVCSSKQNSRF
jgi:hypothetical protein